MIDVIPHDGALRELMAANLARHEVTRSATSYSPQRSTKRGEISSAVLLASTAFSMCEER